MRNMLALSAFVIVSAGIADMCPDTTPAHYYSMPDKTFKTGLPPKGAKLASKLTTCELYELQNYCVKAINVYRTGTVKFSDGKLPSFRSVGALSSPDTPLMQCSNERALSDLTHAKNGANCGLYTKGLDCKLGVGGSAENSCCPKSCADFTSCKAILDNCLKAMYDQGRLIKDGKGGKGGKGDTEKAGHYLNMISSSKKHVVCGFGFDTDGSMLATQNFYDYKADGKPCKYNCGTASLSAQCGKCFGVAYCTSASDCKSAPTCFASPGTCNKGVCAYTTPAAAGSACPAGTCQNNKCVQQCHDSQCSVCSTTAAGSCTKCKTGFVLTAGKCVNLSCVEVAGLPQAATYRHVGVFNGQPAYQSQTNEKYFLVMYCCGWGWAITGSATGGAAYKKSDVTTGAAVDSSGKWAGAPGITISQCASAPTTLRPTRPPTQRPTAKYTENLEVPPLMPTDAEMQGTCESGFLQDCAGTCWEGFDRWKAKLGDTECDDFTSAVDLNCARFKCDMADCFCAGAWEVNASAYEPAVAALEDWRFAPAEEGPPDDVSEAATMAVPPLALIMSLFGSYWL